MQPRSSIYIPTGLISNAAGHLNSTLKNKHTFTGGAGGANNGGNQTGANGHRDSRLSIMQSDSKEVIQKMRFKLAQNSAAIRFGTVNENIAEDEINEGSEPDDSSTEKEDTSISKEGEEDQTGSSIRDEDSENGQEDEEDDEGLVDDELAKLEMSKRNYKESLVPTHIPLMNPEQVNFLEEEYIKASKFSTYFCNHILDKKKSIV